MLNENNALFHSGVCEKNSQNNKKRLRANSPSTHRGPAPDKVAQAFILQTPEGVIRAVGQKTWPKYGKRAVNRLSRSGQPTVNGRSTNGQHTVNTRSTNGQQGHFL